MRILRISLKDYRGVADRSIEFAPSGVTIVEGPNEVGKSSTAEAIDRIIEDLDSSGRSRVLAIKPVDRDVGPEVSIEVESGQYAFSYRKRFLRQPETELHVHRPTAEHHTGREAHARAEAILSETVDMALWRALRLQQGNQVGQAELANKTSLARALERAAGEASVGERETSLLGAAQAEFLDSWTESGRRRREAQGLEAEAARSTERARALETALEATESDIDASETLTARVRELTEHRASHTANAEAHRQRVEGLRWMESVVEAVVQRHENATLGANEARRIATARRDLVMGVAAARETAAQRTSAAEEDRERLTGTQARTAEADRALMAVRAERDLARARVHAAQAQVTRERDAAELAALEDRYRRGSEANAVMEAARADAALPVTEERLSAIREAAQSIERARLQLETARPFIRLEALTSVHGIMDGKPLQLGPGRSIEQRLGYRVSLDVPGVLRLGLSAGSAGTADEWGMNLPAQEARVAEMLRELGAWSLAEAEQLLARRQAAERTIGEQGRIIDAVLQGSTPAALAERIQALRAAVEAPVMLDAGDPLGAQQALEDAERRMFAAEHEWQAAHQHQGRLEVAVQGLATEARLASDEADRLEATLATERGAWPDEAAEADLANAEAHEAAVARELASAREQLDGLAPDEARDLQANAQRALERIDRDARAAQDRLLEVGTRLRDHHEDGVEEELVEARMALDDAADVLRRDEAQAATRKLLFETLREERDQAGRSYAGPLRKEMERLGRIVFGPTFKVELDPGTLEVVNRTVRGRKVPFESLSIGAQEQIAIIGRLACATLVAPGGGVPVILDDALGNSDPRRLEAMGAVLAAAGRKNQIIVLTCQPDRYEHVGDARVVPLG